MTNISLKTIILEGQIEQARLTPEELVAKFKNRVFIFFDTETTGLDPRRYFALITEIAAIAINMETGENMGSYTKKSTLPQGVIDRMEWEDRPWVEPEPPPGRPPKPKMKIADILKMTNYREGNTPYVTEAELLKGFVDFINSFAEYNPVLVAHNARFDMYQVGKALERNHLQRPKRFSVLDTLPLVKNYLNPLLLELERGYGPGVDPEVDRILAKVRPARAFINRLGNLGDAFEITTTHWHEALADTEQLGGVTSAILKFLEKRSIPGDNIKSKPPQKRPKRAAPRPLGFLKPQPKAAD